MAAAAEAVCLDYEDLVRGADLSAEIAQAYGYDGLGVLTVKNIPHLVERKMRLLPLAWRFAQLSDEVKAKYEHPESYYSFGWSHGKEKLQGTPDYAKGSYYANPQYDNPVEDPEIIAKHPSFVHPNIWPTEDLPELQDAFKELGQLVVNTGLLVARQCDKFVHNTHSSYPEDKLHTIIDTSKCCKARLLHYFSRSAEEIAADQTVDLEFSNWCGWHNDHGSLTGLVGAIYTDENGNQVPCPDPTAGLYVRNRRSELVKVNIPADQLAFQIGETAQIHSGGLLQATPHAVRGANVAGVSRQTYAVFMEPMWDYPMDVPEGVDPAAAQSASAAENLPRGVPRLNVRWEAGIDFGEFTNRTHQNYY